MMATGVIYCLMLCSCLALRDYRRAGEWTEVVDRCAHTTGHGGFPGDCRTHCTAVLVKRGAWAKGEQEALRAFEETQAFDLLHALAWLLSRSVSSGCAEATSTPPRRHSCARTSSASVRSPGWRSSSLPAAMPPPPWAEALDDQALDGLARAQLQLARVEIALAHADAEAVRAAADDLEQTAATIGTPGLAASAAYACGSAELTHGNPLEAARLFALAQQRWLEAEAPYEAARTRELLAQAQFAAGRADACLLAPPATRAAFQRLGAQLDTERVELQFAALT